MQGTPSNSLQYKEGNSNFGRLYCILSMQLKMLIHQIEDLKMGQEAPT